MPAEAGEDELREGATLAAILGRHCRQDRRGQAMSRANILNTGTASYLELIGNGKTYRVPPYQRDYAWTQQEWEDLWNDVVEMRGDPDGRHYMGALVVQARGDREFFVIDGQQRLATISLLALAIIDTAATHGGCGCRRRNGIGSGRPSSATASSAEKDPASLVESSRLRLNETDDPFYQDYLVQLRPPLNPRGLPGSNALLWKWLPVLLATDRRAGSPARAARASRSRGSCPRPSPAACCLSSSRWTTS